MQAKVQLCFQRIDGEKSDLHEIDENRKDKFVRALMPLTRRKWELVGFPYLLHNFDSRWSVQLSKNWDHATNKKIEDKSWNTTNLTRTNHADAPQPLLSMKVCSFKTIWTEKQNFDSKFSWPGHAETAEKLQM